MYKVALWGIGVGYNTFVSLNGYSHVEPVAITDSDAKSLKKIDGIPVITKSDLFAGKVEYDYIIVTVDDNRIYKEIANEAVAGGISRDIILPVKIFKIPFFNFDEYIEIKKSNLSIISDYCFAGLLYHRFGFEFTSPTINMFTDNENFYRFISNLEENLKLPMEKIDDTVNVQYRGFYTYPMGRVGDCEWCFNHDTSFEAAKERWDKGVERFNFDNYLVVMTIRSDEMAYKFDRLPIKNKIGFYWKDLKLDSVVYLPEWNSGKIRKKFYYNFAILANHMASEEQGVRAVNWMKALQHKKDFRRTE